MKVTLADLVSLYLKSNRIEWAVVLCGSPLGLDEQVQIVAENITTVEQHKKACRTQGVEPFVFHNAILTTQEIEVPIIGTDEDLRRAMGEYPMILWKDLLPEQRQMLKEVCVTQHKIITEWDQCPEVPAVIVWHLMHHFTEEQQHAFYCEVLASYGGLQMRWSGHCAEDTIHRDVDRIRYTGERA
jgi:hypothetical protein